jgi:DnaB-like helicase N terminal domain/AAA domain
MHIDFAATQKTRTTRPATSSVPLASFASPAKSAPVASFVPRASLAPLASPDPFLDPALPSNLEAARAILGGVLLNNDRISALATAHPDDFFLRQHQIIARTMISLSLLNTPIDLVTLTEELDRRGALEDAGGVAYISQLADGLPRTANLDHYARIVRQKSHLRQVAFGAEAIQLAALEPDADIADLTQRIQNLAEAASRSPQPRLKSVTSDGLLQLEVAAREMVLAPVLPTQGLGMLYSKRGLGKTYMSLSIAHAVASGGSFLGWTAPRARPVLFVDGELPLSTLKARLAAVTQGAETQAEPGMLRLITPDLQTGAFPDLATAEGQSLIENALDGAEFVILDNLSALCRTGKENEGESWLPV